MKEYIGNCVGNPFGSLTRLSEVIDDAKSISKKKFLEECNTEMELHGYPLKQTIKQFPNDFDYYQYKDIMFFTHSCIEYFFR
jgi:hypothetical protein